jgi:magnesium chelatase family protein
MDRFDLRVEVPPVSYTDLGMPASGETSGDVASRVSAAHDIQKRRYEAIDHARSNADCEGQLLEEIARPDDAGQALISKVAEKIGLSARGYHRILRVARTIADLEGADHVERHHIAEAAGFRLTLSPTRKS